MEFEKLVYRAVTVILLIVAFLSVILFFKPFLLSGYEGFIEYDGPVLAAMYGISVLGLVILYFNKKV